MSPFCLRCVAFVLLMSSAMAAPLQKGPSAPSAVQEVQKQEAELQSLLDLADSKSSAPDVTVHEEHVQHTHEVNGHKVEVDTQRKTVSETETGKVLSDVKQEVNKDDEKSAGAGQPEVEVKTEIDVPAEGIHETIVQKGTETEPPSPEMLEEALEEEAGSEEEELGKGREEEEEEEEDVFEFNPEAVADYLYRTGDFDRFYSALAQLVNASIMTEAEAQSYSQMVALEYDRLQLEDYQSSILVQRRAPQLLERYPLPVDAVEGYPVPMDTQEAYPVAMETPEALYALERAQAMAGPRNEDFELDPYNLLSALWNEAYGSGDARAQALVGELFDKVRDDNIADDEGQVRDILLDLIANSVMSEEEPMGAQGYGWQPIPDDEPFPVEPIRGPVPVPAQPITDEEEAAEELLGQGEKRAADQPIKAEEANASEGKQPTESSDTVEPAKPQPIAAAETNTEPKGTAQQPEAPAKLPTQKRAAETVNPQA